MILGFFQRSWIASLRTFRTLAFFSLDSLCQLIPARRQNVTVIIRLDAVGDFFMWLQGGAADVAEFARQPGRRTVMFANCAWADYARTIGLWDEVIDVDPAKLMRHPLYRLHILWRVRRLGAKLLIQSRSARVFLQEDEIARISGASVRIGSSGTFLNTGSLLRWIGDKCYDRLIPVSEAKAVHETERNDEFVRGLTGMRATRVDLSDLHPTGAATQVAVAVGAGEIGRVWPMENFAGLLRHLKETRPSWSVVLLGATPDKRLAEQLTNLLPPGSAENRVGQTTLREFVDAIAASALIICNDSSAFHIAMTLEKRVICFLGGGHFGWFAPYPVGHPSSSKARVLSVPMDCFWCNWKCIYPTRSGGTLLCVDSIPVHAAIASLEGILKT